MPFSHALLEHEIGRHSRLGCRIGILPANLQHRGCVVVGLARLLRAHHRISAHQDDCCANKAFERRSRGIPYYINHRLASECYGPGYCPAPLPEARFCRSKPRRATSAVGPLQWCKYSPCRRHQRPYRRMRWLHRPRAARRAHRADADRARFSARGGALPQVRAIRP